MDIGKGNGYPSSALSNLAPHAFIFNNVECASAEGVLQSFKFSNPEMQKYVCTLAGLKAKFKGKNKNWYRTQTLYWQGQEIARASQEYQNLLDNLYLALATNEGFRRALLATNNAVLQHTIGKTDITRTVLTQQEFCSRLTKLRSLIRSGKLAF